MWLVLSIILLTFVISGLGNKVLKQLLKRHNILDYPTTRSSHTQPKPRGGGIAVIFAITIGALCLEFANVNLPSNFFVVGVFSLLIATISWIDDYKDLSPLFRLSAQSLCVVITLANIDLANVATLSFLPSWALYFVLGLAWLWFTNLYNFMDGIDGITGIETICITLGILLLSTTGDIPSDLAGPASVVFAATVGFLIFNWPPAQIFLGDVGSVPLGFLIGWMLIELVCTGQWAAAIILPAYYLLDATITLFKRLCSGSKLLHPHREHFYQKAVHGQLSHSGVILRVLLVNISLIIISVTIASEYPYLALFSAILTVLFFLFHLKSYFSKNI